MGGISLGGDGPRDSQSTGEGLGAVETSLSEPFLRATFQMDALLGTKDGVLVVPLPGGGRIVIMHDVIADGGGASVSSSTSLDLPQLLRFQIRGRQMTNTRKFSSWKRPDLCFEVRRRIRRRRGDAWCLVYRSEVDEDSVNPFWSEALVDMEQFCGSDLECAVRVTVIDMDRKHGGRGTMLGSFETTVRNFVEMQIEGGNWSADKAILVNKDGKVRGKVAVIRAELISRMTKTVLRRSAIYQHRRMFADKASTIFSTMPQTDHRNFFSNNLNRLRSTGHDHTVISEPIMSKSKLFLGPDSFGISHGFQNSEHGPMDISPTRSKIPMNLSQQNKSPEMWSASNLSEPTVSVLLSIDELGSSTKQAGTSSVPDKFPATSSIKKVSSSRAPIDIRRASTASEPAPVMSKFEKDLESNIFCHSSSVAASNMFQMRSGEVRQAPFDEDHISNDLPNVEQITGLSLPLPLAYAIRLKALELPPLPRVPEAPTAIHASSPSPTLNEYINAGNLHLDLCIAIDFSSYNGALNFPGTRHNLTDRTKNDYEWTISVLASVVMKLSPNMDVPVWGFGAAYGGILRHIFQCGSSATANSVDGILNAYRSVYQTNLVPSDVVNYESVIKATVSNATQKAMVPTELSKFNKKRSRLSYTVLLVVTPGDKNAFEMLKDQLDLINTAPISVVFICLGGERQYESLAAADDMSILDGGLTKFTFIDFEQHHNGRRRDAQSLVRAVFGEEGMGGISEQIVEYFVSKGIYPNSLP